MNTRAPTSRRRRRSPFGLLSSLSAVLLASAAFGACRGPARSQILLSIDGDFAVSETAYRDARVSPDAVIDTLRIDFLDPQTGRLEAVHEVTLANESDLPASLGIAMRDDEGDGDFEGAAMRVRLRAFRAALATREYVSGRAVLQPAPGVTIDRVIDLPALRRRDTTRHVAVTLSMNCLGVATSFEPPVRSCVDDADATASPLVTADSWHDEDYGEPEPRPPSRVGTWPGMRERPCAASATEGRACVPGGFLIMGDPEVNLMSDRKDDFMPMRFEAWPGRPARLSPFWMDRTELRVSEYKALVRAGLAPERAPELADGSNCGESKFGTWRGFEDVSYDEYPLNCVRPSLAQDICVARGGTLPTEAQWEYAARGRGARRRYPWGDADPSCCNVSAGRLWVKRQNECLSLGPEPAGSHPRSEACGGAGDVSRDDVLDLGGSLAEPVLGQLLRYDDPCWGRGPTLDPLCQPLGDDRSLVLRGADWSSGPANAQGALRFSSDDAPTATLGLRCVYQDAP